MNRRSSVSLATHFVPISCQIIIISLSLHPRLLHHPSYHALVAELADAPDLGSGVPRREGSSPFRRTIQNPNCLNMSSQDFCFYVFAELLRVYLYKSRQKCHNISFNILFLHIEEKTTLQLCFFIKISYLCRRNGNSQI